MESNDYNKLEDLLRRMYAKEEEIIEHSDDTEGIDTSAFIDEEWQKFKDSHFKAQPLPTPVGAGLGAGSVFTKLAAAFIGLLMLSGITYAAIHIAHQHQQTEASTPADTTATTNATSITLQSSLSQDSIAQPQLYDNVPLGEILDELFTYYNIKVVYYTEDARHPRLYYQWKPEYTIEKVVEMLNNFEWLQMELKQDTLYVKSTAIPANDC